MRSGESGEKTGPPRGTRLRFQKRGWKKNQDVVGLLSSISSTFPHPRKKKKNFSTPAHISEGLQSNSFGTVPPFTSPLAVAASSQRYTAALLRKTTAAATAREHISQTDHFIERGSGNRCKCIIGAECK